MTRKGSNLGWYWRQWQREITLSRAATALENTRAAAEAVAKADTHLEQMELELGEVRDETSRAHNELRPAALPRPVASDPGRPPAP